MTRMIALARRSLLTRSTNVHANANAPIKVNVLAHAHSTYSGCSPQPFRNPSSTRVTPSLLHGYPMRQQAFLFSTNANANETAKNDPTPGVSDAMEDKPNETEKTDSNDKNEEPEDDLRGSINRLLGKEESETTSDTRFSSSNETLNNAGEYWSTFSTEVSKTWQELLDSGKPSSINKKLRSESDAPSTSTSDDTDSDSATPAYDGPSSLMLVDEKLGTWEKMQKRLSEAPIIQDILGASHRLYTTAGGEQAKQRLDDLKEDANEAWETSQNPWVYRLSSIWDTVTAETEFAVAVRELRRLDPEFQLETFKENVSAEGGLFPELLGHFLHGRTKELKPWLGEAVYNRLGAEIRVRKSEGLVVDPHILSMENSEIIAAEVDVVNKGSPILLLHFMCQQINCVRKSSDGSIVEGGEDEIRANSYICAFQREYNEVDNSLEWKVIDFRFNGGIAWV
mmetsp:Transcript_43386/g.52063  ORF Transcript_43386/g.52063 Transcript_43386/m.52063 type:complete len:453 (-) Transcript_43386:435-1793(-)